MSTVRPINPSPMIARDLLSVAREWSNIQQVAMDSGHLARKRMAENQNCKRDEVDLNRCMEIGGGAS